MNKNNKQIGVITEQGFIMGENLGFKPVKEKELNTNQKKTEEKKNSNKKEK